jgi:hypothetical protein
MKCINIQINGKDDEISKLYSYLANSLLNYETLEVEN